MKTGQRVDAKGAAGGQGELHSHVNSGKIRSISNRAAISDSMPARPMKSSPARPAAFRRFGRGDERNRPHQAVRALAFLVVLSAALFWPGVRVHGYSVLTHEALIDSAWDDSIKPLLLTRFPSATAADLVQAHGYAYGGAIIQDMGYYPFGSRLFSDLAHYVRSGDFVIALIQDSQDINQYAFSLGALCHYAADSDGHSIAVNRSVPIEYPHLGRQYGPDVTYEEDPTAHLKTEFGFDVAQVARGRYAPQSYHDFVGFSVSKPLLERAFKETYGVELKSLFTSLDLALGSYRRSVSTVIPEMSRVAWDLKKKDIKKEIPGATRRKFIYNLSRSSFEKEWGASYQKPGFFARTLAFLFRIIPPVGPFKALEFKPPTPQTEKLFMASFDASLLHYRNYLGEVGSGKLALENRNLDTGSPTRSGQYGLADSAYAKLLDKVSKDNFSTVSPELRENIMAFYSDAVAPASAKKRGEDWSKTMQEVSKLKGFQPAGENASHK
jgi:hypothetical protein